MTTALPELHRPPSMPAADGIDAAETSDPADAAGAAGLANGVDLASSGGDVAAECAIVLVGLSHPALGDIAIEDALFAVGRTEPPFDAYPAELVADLSRRHARIFCESGVVHVADMGSKNGTAVNDVDIRQKTARLQDGDELRFGRQLRYRVRLQPTPPQAVYRLVSLTLEPLPQPQPDQPDQPVSMLDQIVVRTFPFLVSKNDATFARYRVQHAQQLHYLSRRHAHVFLRRGLPFVEDLGSTNGTFVNGRRLDEHAVPLADDDTLAFGGHHFVYRVRLEREPVRMDPTLTRFSALEVTGAGDGEAASSRQQSVARLSALQPDRTMFIVAPDSFLDIFCIDPPLAPGMSLEVARSAHGHHDGSHDKKRYSKNPPDRKAPYMHCNSDARQPGLNMPTRWPRVFPTVRRRAACLQHRLASGLPLATRRRLRRTAWSGAALVASIAIGSAAWHAGNAPERRLQALVAAGRYQEVAVLSATRMRADPGNAAASAMATESWLKAYLPPWMAALQARDAHRVDATLSVLRQNARDNPAAAPLIDELALIGWLARTVGPATGDKDGSVGGSIRLFFDEDRIAALLAQWERDPAGHQLRAAEIGAAAPAFRAVFASALSDLRRLQSDSAVTLGAIARLKSGVAEALAQERPGSIAGLLDTTVEKAPRLSGLDLLRDDLRNYLLLQQSQRDGRLGPITRAVQRGFKTPPFRDRLTLLMQTGRLPPQAIVEQMRRSADAWFAGDIDHAQGLLDRIDTAPWAQAAAAEATHRRNLLAAFTAFAALRVMPEASAKAETVDLATVIHLAGQLDPDTDGFLWRRLQAQPGFDRARLTTSAQNHATQAAQSWQQYRGAGAIDPADLVQESLSEAQRSQVSALYHADESMRLAQREQALSGNAPDMALLPTADAISLELARLQAELHNAAQNLPMTTLQARSAMLDGHGGSTGTSRSASRSPNGGAPGGTTISPDRSTRLEHK